jgi:UDP-N-acetyl-D-glucosamine dehydrogenase
VKIAVIGQGYVGFPLAQIAAKSGFKVIGYDNNPNVIHSINTNEANLELTDNMDLLANCDVYVIAVPTPLDNEGRPDLSYVIEASKTVSKYAKSGSLVINESTSFPGTLREIIAPIIDKSASKILFAAAPERIDPLNKNWNLTNTTRVIGGLTKEATDKAAKLYSSFCTDIFTVNTPEIAESAKLLENTFRQVNIAFINQFAQIMDRFKIPVHEVINAAATKPFGFMKFSPGLGVGGHCIPIDPIYLAEKAESVGAPTSLIRSADQINKSMPKYVLEKAKELLGGKISGKKVCIVGLPYKSDISDLRSSPSIALWDELTLAGAEIYYHDSFHTNFRGKNSTDFVNSRFDLVIVATRHSDLNTNQLFSSTELVLDCTGSIAGAHRI